MEPFKVGLVDVGENLPINLSHLARKLNSIQKAFIFEDVPGITSDVLGEPEIEDEWYDVSHILNLLREKIDANTNQFFIGITNSKISDKSDLINNKPDKDYFSQSDFNKFTIISANSRVLQYITPNKSVEMYLAHLFMGELLMNLIKQNLSHTGHEPCLFNECEDRSIIYDCIKKGRICISCMSKLKTKNINESLLEEVQKVLKWSKPNTWSYSIKSSLQHPISSFAVGTGLGWFSSMYIGKEYYLLILIITCLPLLIFLILSRLSKIG